MSLSVTGSMAWPPGLLLGIRGRQHWPVIAPYLLPRPEGRAVGWVDHLPPPPFAMHCLWLCSTDPPMTGLGSLPDFQGGPRACSLKGAQVLL